jgi:hypothetical protein
MRKTVIIGSAVLLVASIAGFITSLVLNAFVLDDYDAYGEVPIPGSRTLHLPAGDATVTFHTVIIGSTSGGGLPVPELGVSIIPPSGVAKPELTEKIGGTTTVNNDARRQVWIAHVPESGDYTVKTDGKVSAFIEPQLAFGHGSRFGYLPWVFGGVFAVSLLALLASTILLRGGRPVTRPPDQPPSGAVEL